MQTSFSVIVLVLLGGVLSAQPTLRATLAREICDCMVDERGRTMRRRANLCLIRISGKYEDRISSQYALSVRGRRGRESLVDTIAAPLSAQCPELVAYFYGTQLQRHWSDMGAGDPSLIYVAEVLGADAGAELKGEGAMNVTSAVTEGPAEMIYSGLLTKLDPDGKMILSSQEGQRVMYLPAKLRQKHAWAIGMSYNLLCRRTVSRGGEKLIWRVSEVR
ncbi:hypothetical protein [Neolewinella antarctica]|uniref:Uncharacterized protein n=1 Tax=Neolewinella antarctica TaxID=442734 RepID=A0ABX0X8G6_9BACT|nr:hypothetical protein [Neolewinella antarctica]NJC25545.1 hypothetical protein [Neolewinella antarctica]